MELNSSSYEIYPTLTQFFDYYLTRRDAEMALSLVTDDIFSLGTGAHEVAYNKAEFAALVREEIAQYNGPIEFQLQNYREKQLAPGIYTCISDVVSSMPVEGEGVIHLQTRLTAGFRKENGRYLAYQFHMSEASSTQEEREFFPLRYGTEELRKINRHSQVKLLELMKKVIPGGVIGGYLEPDYPLYIINDELLRWLGYTYEEFVQDSQKKISNTIHPDDLDLVNDVVKESFSHDDEYTVEYRMKKKDGSYIWVYDIGRKIVTDDGRDAIISVIMDISSDVQLKRQLKEEAMKDPLTGIYNRKTAMQLTNQYMSKPGTYGFLLLDIDDFKGINDHYGHQTGDQVLIRLSEILNQLFRTVDVIARLGGDEFLIFAPDVPSETFLLEKADSIQKIFQEEAEKLCPQQRTGVSLGGIFGKGQSSFEDLYPAADALLYQVKQNGKGSAKIVTTG